MSDMKLLELTDREREFLGLLRKYEEEVGATANHATNISQQKDSLVARHDRATFPMGTHDAR